MSGTLMPVIDGSSRKRLDAILPAVSGWEEKVPSSRAAEGSKQRARLRPSAHGHVVAWLGWIPTITDEPYQRTEAQIDCDPREAQAWSWREGRCADDDRGTFPLGGKRFTARRMPKVIGVGRAPRPACPWSSNQWTTDCGAISMDVSSASAVTAAPRSSASAPLRCGNDREGS